VLLLSGAILKLARRLTWGSRRARRTEAAQLKANLQQLLRDVRRAEAGAEPPRKFEPDARHQLRLLLGNFAPRRSQLQIFNSEENGISAQESELASSSGHPLLRRRSIASAA
jgi:hypothetical protein